MTKFYGNIKELWRPRKDKRGARIVFDCRMANDAASISCELANMV
jgi:hypothetical protein